MRPGRSWLSLLLACSLLAGCGRVREPDIAAVAFELRGIVVRLTVPAEHLSATVYDADGARVGSTTLGSGQAQELRIVFPWQAGRLYQVLVSDGRGREWTREALAPDRPSSPIEIDLQIPFGRQMTAASRDSGVSLMALGSTVTGNLVLQNLEPIPLVATVQVHLPATLRARSAPPAWRLLPAGEGQIMTGEVALNVQGQTWFGMFTVQATETPVSGLQAVPVEVSYQRVVAGKAETRAERSQGLVKLVSQAELAGLLKVERVTVPTSVTGQVDARWRAGAIVLPDPELDGLRSLLKLNRETSDEDKPVAYAAVTLRSQADADVISLVRMHVTAPGSDAPLPQFAAVDPHGGSAPYSDNVIVVPANEAAVVVLRVYADAETLSGEYAMQVRATLFGADTVIDQVVTPLSVVRRNLLPALLTGAVMLIALGSMIWLGLRGRRALGGFGVRSLVTIALFGASSFLSVNVPNIVFDDLVRALLGPFSFFINGLFSHFLRSVLLFCLVAVVARPGVVALMTAVRFLLASMVLGSFSLVSLLALAAEALIVETALYLSGATRIAWRSGDQLWSRRRLLVIAVVFGAAQVLDSFIGFNLMMFLSRLYYADWYLVAYLAISAFGYSLIGAWMGGRLGQQLRKVMD